MSYEKNEWKKRDYLIPNKKTIDKLNHLEDGLASLEAEATYIVENIDGAIHALNEILLPLFVTFSMDPNTPGHATIDTSLSDIQDAHQFGRRIILRGQIPVGEDGAVAVMADLTTFVYSVEGSLVGWTAVLCEFSNDYDPQNIYLVQSTGDYNAQFTFCNVT